MDAGHRPSGQRRVVTLPDAGDHLVLLGRFVLCRHGVELVLPSTEQRLVGLLALRGPQSRAQVWGSLWPDGDDAHAAAALRSVLWRVRRVDASLVEARGDALALDPALPVDVHHLLLQAGRQVPAPVTDVPQGELLPGSDDPWVVERRPQVLEAQVHLLLIGGEQHRAQQAYGAALACAHAALRIDPLRESAHRLVLEVHLDEGDVAAVVRGYEAYAELLRTEMGLQPSARIRSLLPR